MHANFVGIDSTLCFLHAIFIIILISITFKSNIATFCVAFHLISSFDHDELLSGPMWMFVYRLLRVWRIVFLLSGIFLRSIDWFVGCIIVIDYNDRCCCCCCCLYLTLTMGFPSFSFMQRKRMTALMSVSSRIGLSSSMPYCWRGINDMMCVVIRPSSNGQRHSLTVIKNEASPRTNDRSLTAINPTLTPRSEQLQNCVSATPPPLTSAFLHHRFPPKLLATASSNGYHCSQAEQATTTILFRSWGTLDISYCYSLCCSGDLPDNWSINWFLSSTSSCCRPISRWYAWCVSNHQYILLLIFLYQNIEVLKYHFSFQYEICVQSM